MSILGISMAEHRSYFECCLYLNSLGFEQKWKGCYSVGWGHGLEKIGTGPSKGSH